MLTLNDGRSELWQWDTGRKLTVDAECSEVHFSNKVFGRSIDVDVVDGVASIPDILLQTDKELTAWAFVGTPENGYTKISKVFKVNKRNKPADYVFTPPEQTTLGELMERLDKVEESQDPDAIKNAVNDYLANNPIQIDEKDPTVPDWAKQPQKPTYTAEEVGAVATVNGISPDENGNVEIEIGGVSVEGAVLYTPQTLTEEQKAQARTNIGAATAESVNQLSEQVVDEKTAREACDAVLSARMDTFTALPEGSTTGDAELIDGRVDKDGVTHHNIGEHIRNVTGQLSEEIDTVYDDLKDLEGVYADGELLNGYDSTDVTDGVYFAYPNGFVTEHEEYRACNRFTKIKPDTDYYAFFWLNNGWFSTTAFIVCWYDRNKNFISGQYADRYHSPANARYVRISVKKAWSNPIFCESEECSGVIEYGYSENFAEITNKRLESIENTLGATADNGVICVRNGSDFQIKTHPIGFDKPMCFNWKIGGSQNKGLDMDYAILADDSEDDEIATGTNYKYCGDDICPVNYNSSFHGGNHGQDGAFFVTQTNHGKTLADIGSTWKDANNRVYTLWYILDNNRIGVVAETDNPSYPVEKTAPASPLTHVSGATHTSNITFTATASAQLRPSINNYFFTIRSDGGETLDKDGVIYGKHVDVIERYGIPNVTSMLSHLRNNVPNNTLRSMCDDSIEIDGIYETTYRYFDSGCCLISCTFIPVKEGINLSTFGITQSQVLGDKSYTPYTTRDTISTISSEDIFKVDKWKDATFPPYKFYQFDDNGNGFVTGYPLIGDGSAEIRKTSCADGAGYYYEQSKKCYPNFYAPATPKPDLYGDSVSGFAFRSPVKKTNHTLAWYKIGSSYYLEIELFGVFDGNIELPFEMDGRLVEVAKKYDTVSCLSKVVSANTIYLKSTDIGSITLKIS